MYDKPYFYARRVSRYDTYQIMIATVWFATFRPRKVYDLGCGIGSYLWAFRRLGCRISGSDIGYPIAKEYMRAYVRKHTYEWDARKVVPKETPADLILCLDVAEHIPLADHGAMWESFKRIGRGLVLFAGGLLHQPGCGHIACQTRAKWIDDGKAHGLAHDEVSTAHAVLALNSIGDPLGFMNRLLVFRVPT